MLNRPMGVIVLMDLSFARAASAVSRLALCLLFALSFSSCESGGDAELAEEPRATAATNSFDSVVKVKLMVPDPASGKNVELRSNEQLKAIVAKYAGGERTSGIRAQGENHFSPVGQQINPDSSSPIVIAEKGYNLPDDAQEFYVNVLCNSRSANMGGAVLTNPQYAGGDEDDPEPTSYTATTTWTYYQVDGEDSDGKIGVVMANLEMPNSAPIVNDGGGTVEVVANWTSTRISAPEVSPQEYDIDLTISVEGTEVFSVREVRQTTGFDGDLLRILPVFESTASGTYRITARDVYSNPPFENFNGSEFIQRGLVLDELPLQDYELVPGDIAVISNSFAWDFGDNPNDLQEASWDVKITNPAGEQVALLSGTGNTISASWDPTPLAGPIRLKPKGRETPDGGTPIYAYEIIMRALAYDNASTIHEVVDKDFSGSTPLPDDVFYEVSSAVAPTELKIINAELTPDPPFQNEGDSVELTAEVLAIGYEGLTDEDVDWWVELIDPDGNPVGPPLGTGKGFSVSATWDGKAGGAAVEFPAAYSFSIKAIVSCEAPLARSLETRGQVSQCGRLAQLNFPLGGAALKFFALDGHQVDVMKPSYLFEVRQTTEVVDRDEQDPGTQQGEVLKKGQASLIKVQASFSTPMTADGTVTMRVGPYVNVLNPTADPAGHHHPEDPPPSGLLFEENPGEDTVLTTLQRSWIGDVSKEGGNPIADVRELELDVATGQTVVSAYYLAPVTSGRRRIEIYQNGLLLADKTINIRAVDLQPLFPALQALNDIYVVQDFGVPAPLPEQRDKGVMVTGRTSKHGDNVYGDPAFNAKLVELAKTWGKEGKGMLWLNDMSLPQGGKFEIGGDYSRRSRHFEHRLGQTIDVSTDLVRAGKRDRYFERLCNLKGLAVYMELVDRHYHLRSLDGLGGN